MGAGFHGHPAQLGHFLYLRAALWPRPEVPGRQRPMGRSDSRRVELLGRLVISHGLPVTVGESPDTSNAGSLAPRPDALRNAILPSDKRSPDLWFDTTAFARQAPNTFGNAGNGTLRDPGINDIDFSRQKQFSITERRRFEFRV